MGLRCCLVIWTPSFIRETLPCAIASGRNWLVQLDTPEEEILQRQQIQQEAVAQPSHAHNTHSRHCVEPVVVGRSHNDGQDEHGVYEAQNGEEDLAELGHALLAGGETATEDAGVV